MEGAHDADTWDQWGLENAIIGTLVLMAGVFIIAGTIGVFAGIHLASLPGPAGTARRSGGLLRTASDVLSGFPSIVLGYVGLRGLVVGLHWGFSLLPALIILSIMVHPLYRQVHRVGPPAGPEPAIARGQKHSGCRRGTRYARWSSKAPCRAS